jgi:hypothetical protein
MKNVSKHKLLLFKAGKVLSCAHTRTNTIQEYKTIRTHPTIPTSTTAPTPRPAPPMTIISTTPPFITPATTSRPATRAGTASPVRSRAALSIAGRTGAGGTAMVVFAFSRG